MDFNKKYTNRDILIVGGGTSTIDVKWEKLINSDTFIWTCNDFYLNERVTAHNIDLFQLAYTTDLSNDKLIEYLKRVKPFTYFEYNHYRQKWNDPEFKKFEKKVGYGIPGMNIDIGQVVYSEGQKSGAVLRLIMLALATNAKNIYFVGFDGFNRNFSNAHAFTGHKGLKKSDTRRDWVTGYYDVFMQAYLILAEYDSQKRLQNLGEGFDYNIASEVSRKYFPLRKEIYETIR